MLNEPIDITLPVDVEYALLAILKHYWNRECDAYHQLPGRERIGHIFKRLQTVDDWLFKPYSVKYLDRPRHDN